MKKFLVLLCAVLLSISNVIAQGNRSNYWSPDASMFPNNMTLIGVLQIEGEEQADANWEIGAFCGDEVRGSARLTYQNNVSRYMFFITLYGNTGDKISFKLYDHSTNEVSELVCSTTIDFVVDEIVGGLMSPQVLNFAEITSYWIPDPYTYPNNMNVIAVVNIDGVEQTSTNIELGAFCGDEVRGSVKAQYIPSPINKYEYFITIYGEANDIITFRLYDHDAGEEMAVATTDNITFVINGTEGSIPAPHAINFIASKKVTAVANPVEGGVVTGGGIYNAGETVTLTATPNENYLFINWTENGEVVATESTYSFVAEETSSSNRTFVANFGLFTAPENLTAIAENATTISLTWDAVATALSYNVYRNGNFVSNVTTNSYTDEGLQPFTEYCYTVTSVNGSNEAESESACATTPDLPITVPTNVVATPINASAISLTWTAVANAMSYKVYRNGEFMKSVTTNTYTNTGLEHLTEYCYTVSAVRNDTETEQSESVCATTLDLQITTPTNLTATAESTSTIALTWNSVTNAMSYNLYRDGELLVNLEGTSYTDENLEVYTEYCYTVSALRNETETEQSASVCVKTLDLPVTTPTGLTATVESASAITLAWTAVENALSYNVYRNGDFLINVAATTLADTELNSYTEYCYTVSAVRNETESAQTESVCATTLDLEITVPTNLAAVAESASTIVLTWNAVENALSYNIYRGGELLTNVTAATYTDEGLQYLTEYCYTVSAVRNVTETAQTESVCATTLDLPITVPTNLTATAESTSSIILTWDAVENALSYNVYRGGELLVNITETTYSDEDLEYYTEYCYTVSAVRNEAETAQTESVCATTLDLPITAPTNLTATAESTSSIVLSWETVENALSYNLYRGGEMLVNVADTTYTDIELESYTEYCYTVSAVRNETESAQTESVCATTFDLEISVPTNLAATAESESAISLTWDAVENALSYNIYRGGELLTNVTESAYTDEGLESLTEYCYTVSAVRNVTETEQSESVCATTLDLPITAPVNLAASVEGERTIVLTWDSVENALSYNVYRGGELLTNVSDKTYTDEELEYETEYCYTVTAVRNETESEHSEEVCATTLPDGITENEVAFEFYPNPVDDVLVISTTAKIEEITIYNISGAVMYKEDSFDGTTLNVSNYEKGTYLIRIKSDGRYVTKTFVKK